MQSGLGDSMSAGARMRLWRGPVQRRAKAGTHWTPCLGCSSDAHLPKAFVTIKPSCFPLRPMPFIQLR